jgi:FMN phosphatase YigB (HAD superfamily)
VGDRYDLDVQAAGTAGLSAVWLNRTGANAALDTFPAIRSLNELPAALLHLRRTTGD